MSAETHADEGLLPTLHEQEHSLQKEVGEEGIVTAEPPAVKLEAPNDMFEVKFGTIKRKGSARVSEVPRGSRRQRGRDQLE